MRAGPCVACGLTPNAAAMMSPHDVPSTTPTGRWGILSVMASLIFSSVSSRESTTCIEQGQQVDCRKALCKTMVGGGRGCTPHHHHPPSPRTSPFLGPGACLGCGCAAAEASHRKEKPAKGVACNGSIKVGQPVCRVALAAMQPRPCLLARRLTVEAGSCAVSAEQARDAPLSLDPSAPPVRRTHRGEFSCRLHHVLIDLHAKLHKLHTHPCGTASCSSPLLHCHILL